MKNEFVAIRKAEINAAVIGVVVSCHVFEGYTQVVGRNVMSVAKCSIGKANPFCVLAFCTSKCNLQEAECTEHCRLAGVIWADQDVHST